jgi:hypothetical protein
MAKDTFYFSHDYDPLGDPKIQAMTGDYGAIGYGIFWRIVEMLHTDALHKLPFKKYIYSAIAKQMSTNVQQSSNKILHVELSVEQTEIFIQDCIKEYELFSCDDNFFWSDRALRNIEKKEEISEIRSKAGKTSAEKRKKATKVKQMSTSVEQVKTNVQQNPTKEIKGKEIKGKEIILNSRCYAKIPELQTAAAAAMKNFKKDFNEKILAAQAHELATKYVNKPIDDLQALCNTWMKKYEKEQIELYGTNKLNGANRLVASEVGNHYETPL